MTDRHTGTAVREPGRGVRLVALLIVISGASVALPEMLDELRTAIRIRNEPYSVRRERVLGPLYTSIRELRREVPPEGRVDLVLRNPWDIGEAVIASSYLYPRRVRIYFGTGAYRGDLKAVRAETLVQVDRDSPAVLRRVSYPELRRDEMAQRRVTALTPPVGAAHPSFVVPFVTSFDAVPPDAYVMEASFLAPADTKVEVRWEPFGLSASFALRGGVTRHFNDVAGELFHRTGVGWFHVASAEPVRSAWWLVNRGVRRAAPLRTLAEVPPMTFRLPSTERVWIVNAAPHNASARLGQRTITAEPGAIIGIDGTGAIDVRTDAGIIVYGTTKLPDRNTLFAWPPEPR